MAKIELNLAAKRVEPTQPPKPLFSFPLELHEVYVTTDGLLVKYMGVLPDGPRFRNIDDTGKWSAGEASRYLDDNGRFKDDGSTLAFPKWEYWKENLHWNNGGSLEYLQVSDPVWRTYNSIESLAKSGWFYKTYIKELMQNNLKWRIKE